MAGRVGTQCSSTATQQSPKALVVTPLMSCGSTPLVAMSWCETVQKSSHQSSSASYSYALVKGLVASWDVELCAMMLASASMRTPLVSEVPVSMPMK